MSNTRDFLFEIGVEEMPSGPLDAAQTQLKSLFSNLLTDHKLSFKAVEVFSTPRRLVVFVRELVEGIPESTSVVRGPAVSIAFDNEGVLTKAGLGFLKSKGATADDYTVEQAPDGKDYLFVRQVVPAQRTKDMLSGICIKALESISWPKSQRWGSETVKFIRPIQWMLALFGSEVIKVTYGDVESGSVTYGHRVLSNGAQTVESVNEYFDVLKGAYVLLQDERKLVIQQQIKEIEQAYGSVVETPQKTFAEVVNLCEWPTVVVGTFDKTYLEVPHEIICDAMLSHQRYFPMFENGELTNRFALVSNADPAWNETVVKGNERVVRARLEDAQFFYQEDLKLSLDALNEKLRDVVFQAKLGTVHQKVERVVPLSKFIAEAEGFSEEDTQNTVRAASLCKADLVSQSVIEFTNQQGVMGKYFAQAHGEPKAVAIAMQEHYMPRFANDELPSTIEGAVVSCADKMDTIVGMFAINKPPTGSADPFAIRRCALGVLALTTKLHQMSLEELVAKSLDLYVQQGLEVDVDECMKKILDFFLTRMKVIAKESGIDSDVFEALSIVGVVHPQELMKRMKALQELREKNPELFAHLAQSYVRAKNLSDVSVGTEVDLELFVDAERELYDLCVSTQKTVVDALSKNDFSVALTSLLNLNDAVDAFFENVMVMDPSEKLRKNRIALLNNLVQLFDTVILFEALAKKN